MNAHPFLNFAIATVFLAVPFTLAAQERAKPETLIAAQQQAMAALAAMDGHWRGPAWTILPSGEKHTLTQTERVGSFLNGSIKVIEGRGYEADGSVGFNAFAIVSYDPSTKTYGLHSHAQGRMGDFSLKPTADGYVWEVPAGPMTIRYTVVINDGKWLEVGDRISPGKEPVRFFEMSLTRLGDSTWPAAGAIPPK